MAHAHVGEGVSGQRAVVHRESRRSLEAMIVNVVYFVVSVIEVILLFRFVFRLFGANPSAGFVSLIYALSEPPMALFNAIFPTLQVEGAVFEWSVLVAIAVYAFLAWGVAALVDAVSPRSSSSTIEQVESTRTDEEHHEV